MIPLMRVLGVWCAGHNGRALGLFLLWGVQAQAELALDGLPAVLDRAAAVPEAIVNRVDAVRAHAPVVGDTGFYEAPKIESPLVDELTDAVDSLRQRCRVLDAQLALHFSADKPAQFLQQNQQVLLHCPKGMRFRLGLSQQDRMVRAAQLHWRDADDQRRPALMRFVMPNGQALSEAVFEGDGQPFQVAFVALLEAVGSDAMVGELEPPAGLSLRVVLE